ncbi:MAG: hypothetical protein MUQ65_08975 [Armatimonadetes bacterium]|nr:hypothetical protein [Armatimonadota bacterium]
MRMFSDGRLARTIAYILTAAFAWSMGFTGLTLLPAEAQIVTRAATTQSVAVIPFETRTKVRPETLGEEASATVAVELRDRLLLDVLPKADVTLQMRDLGLRVPFSEVELVRLATELDVALVITGEVRGARIIRSPEGRYAEVVLAVRLFDRVARVDVNGALATGKGPASPDASDEVLLEKALAQAAFSAVDQMKARPTVTAMVLWSRGETAFLNVGTRGGLRNRMHMVAIRGGERIGKVEITNADAIGCYADIIEGPPLRTGDHLRAVYNLPTKAGVERVGVAEMKKKRFETIVIAGAILFGFGSYASRARKLDEGNIAAPNFKARQIANGAEIGYSGYSMSYTYPLRDIQPHPSALITWDAYQGGEGGRIIGYEIVRSGQLAAVVVTDAGQQNIVYDTPQVPRFQELTITIDTVTGGFASVDGTWEVWDPDIDYEADPITIGSPWADFFSDNASDPSRELTNDQITYRWFPSISPGDDYGGMYAGSSYQYAIRPLLVRQDRFGEWTFDHGTEFSTVPNRIVAVSPAGTFNIWYREGPRIGGVYQSFDILPNPELAGNLATVHFYYPVGANEIILQVAADPNMNFLAPNVRTYTIPPIEGEFWTHKSVVGGIDLSLVPGNSGPGTVLWWRIGARNTNDTYEPRPIPDDLNERGWIWSPRRAFQIPIGGSRAEAMHEQPERLSAVRAARARVPRTANTERVLRAE